MRDQISRPIYYEKKAALLKLIGEDTESKEFLNKSAKFYERRSNEDVDIGTSNIYDLLGNKSQ